MTQTIRIWATEFGRLVTPCLSDYLSTYFLSLKQTSLFLFVFVICSRHHRVKESGDSLTPQWSLLNG